MTQEENMNRQQGRDLGAIARNIIDSNPYMTLATADEDGRPWASPAYYAHEGYAEFYWVSSPETTHSRNIAARPEVGIVIFDSRMPIGSGQGVYVGAIAKELGGADLERASPASLVAPKRTGWAIGTRRT